MLYILTTRFYVSAVIAMSGSRDRATMARAPKRSCLCCQPPERLEAGR